MLCAFQKEQAWRISILLYHLLRRDNLHQRTQKDTCHKGHQPEQFKNIKLHGQLNRVRELYPPEQEPC